MTQAHKFINFLDWFTNSIHKWGYWLVFLFSMVEGESVIILASMHARRGVLNIYTIGWIVFLTTLIFDQFLFFIGKRYGGHILTRFPFIAHKSVRIFEFLRKYNTAYILSFRFIYGIRTLSSIVIGISGVPVKRFLILNFIGAVVWTILICWLGYFIGEIALSYLEKTQGIFKNIFIILLILGVLYLGHKIIKTIFKQK